MAHSPGDALNRVRVASRLRSILPMPSHHSTAVTYTFSCACMHVHQF